ncbi:MAG: alanine racemase [Candidatus Thorarchaeota archaeon]|jgi:D-serine deaminase-like pyridoxal phosphate-dependent protein
MASPEYGGTTMKKEISELLSPVALVDIERLDRNIDNMATKAKENGVNLRPHIKTHKCIEIGKKQLSAGASGITVSTPGEAQAFADVGFKDITYAVPLAPDKFGVIGEISRKVSLQVLVDNFNTIDMLDKFSNRIDTEFTVLLKVNCGNNRAGVDPTAQSAIRLAKKIKEASNLEFNGILAHAGHSYSTSSVSEIVKIAEHEQEVMVSFAKTLRKEDTDLTPEVVSIGSTPTARLAESFREGITEIRPGNYAFFDYTQLILGTCEVTDIAFTIQASVIGSYPGRVVIDAGATALSKDRGSVHLGDTGYGKVVSNYSQGIIEHDLTISSLSQEHGKVNIEGGHQFTPGYKLRIIPNHSCLTANLYEYYNVVKGDEVVDRWEIHRNRIES